MTAVLKNIANSKKIGATDLVEQVFQHVMNQIERRKENSIVVFTVPRTYNNTALTIDQRKSVFKRIHKAISSSKACLVSLRWELQHYDYRVISSLYSFDLDVHNLLSSYKDYDCFSIKFNKEKTSYFTKNEGFIMSGFVKSMLT